MTTFVEDYLDTVTEDPETTWEMLTPGFQEESGGFESYEGFWSDQEIVDVSGLKADPDALTVNYRITYASQPDSPEDVQLQLQEDGESFLIAGES
jgi:hypothetical protein